MNRLGNFIKQKRLDEALTQQELAEQLGLTSVTISNLENGQKVGSKTLKALSKKFGIETKVLRRMQYENNQ